MTLCLHIAKMPKRKHQPKICQCTCKAIAQEKFIGENSFCSFFEDWQTNRVLIELQKKSRMKNSKSINQKAFKGAGYLSGAIIGIAAAITAYCFTGNIAISIPLFAGLSIPFGMSIEQRLHVEAKEKEPRIARIMFILIAIGVLAFFSMVIISKSI